FPEFRGWVRANAFPAVSQQTIELPVLRASMRPVAIGRCALIQRNLLACLPASATKSFSSARPSRSATPRRFENVLEQIGPQLPRHSVLAKRQRAQWAHRACSGEVVITCFSGLDPIGNCALRA